MSIEEQGFMVTPYTNPDRQLNDQPVEDPSQEEKDPEVVAEAEPQEPEAFAEDKKGQRHNWKKRYGDLKSYHDKQMTSMKDQLESLQGQIRVLQQAEGMNLPSSESEIEAFKENNPHAYDVILSVARRELQATRGQLDEVLQQQRQEIEVNTAKSAYAQLLQIHPDFEQLRDDEAFLNWLEEGPEQRRNSVFANATDVAWAADTIAQYKSHKSRKPSKSAGDPAADISPNAAGNAPDPSSGEKKVWKTSEIAKMNGPTFEKYEKELELAQREGRIVNG